MRPKLILTDLDGTLLREDKTLSPINRAALERAAAQGAEVVVATGRRSPGRQWRQSSIFWNLCTARWTAFRTTGA